jgi:glutamate 5-kinase
VVKFGTNLLTNRRDSVDEATVANLVAQVAEVHSTGTEVLVVTSGAVGAGRDSLKRTIRPERLHERGVVRKQVLAALGQPQLMGTYQREFGKHGIEVAQALLSRDDLQHRLGYLNVRRTLEALLEIGAIPIVNENDVVAVHEIVGDVYGDNDRLSAMVANAVDADLLILLGELEGLYTNDPGIDPAATLIRQVDDITPEIEEAARGPLDGRGSGGMASKLEAARLATASGTPMVIASGRTERVIPRLCAGEEMGTRFAARVSRMEARRRWMLTGFTDSQGAVSVDDGAVKALRERGVSLLPAGITEVTGQFDRGDIIGVKGANGEVIAFGITNYSSADVSVIKGRKTKDVPDLLGHFFGMEVIHRNNMALP